MTTQTTPMVFAFSCSKCGLEYFSLKGTKPVSRCARCDNGFLPRRVILAAHPDTVAMARREDEARDA